MIMNKIIKVGVAALAALTLTATIPTNAVVSASKLKTVQPDPNASNRVWTYKNNVFDAGNETYIFTKNKVITVGKDKYLIMYCDITNNSTKKMDPSLVSMVMQAHQSTSSQDKQLDTATIGTSNNGLDKLENNLYQKLLPGKSVHAIIQYKLVNNRPVKVTFQDENSNTIGTRNIKVNNLGE